MLRRNYTKGESLSDDFNSIVINQTGKEIGANAYY